MAKLTYPAGTPDVVYPPYLLGPTVGVAGLPAPVLLTATSLSSYIVPASVAPGTKLRGAMTAAGGGGGGVSGVAATAAAGLPGVMLEFVMIVNPGDIIPYKCGTGGAGGTNAGGNGGVGGDTTFGPFTAKGGNLGFGSTSGNAPAGAAMGSGTGGSITAITGSALIPTPARFIVSQGGGISINGSAGSAGTGGQGKGVWGSGGTPGTNGSAAASTGYGAGGSAAGSTASTAGTGAAGAPGAIMLF